MDDAAFSELLEIWQPSKPPRVWSLVVTLFGDLAQTPGAYLSSTTLNAILERIGVKPEATRVALHRLRKDGWIISAKDGRKSNYALTAWGLAECAAANPIIYGPKPALAKAWLFASEPGGTPRDTDGLSAIGTNLFISPKPISDPSAFVVPLQADMVVPTWVRDKLCAPEIVQASCVLHDQLSAFRDQAGSFDQLTPHQIVILRGVIVHAWRRLILRAPPVPDALLPKAWKGSACMQLVTDALDQLPRPALDDLNA